MSSIWKYKLDHNVVVSLPQDSEILCVRADVRGEPAIWLLVDTNKPTVERRFRWFKTGADIPEEAIRYIGTVFAHSDAAVAHVFEMPRYEQMTPVPDVKGQ